MTKAADILEMRSVITLVVGILLSLGLVCSKSSLASPAGLTVTEVADLDQPWAMTFLPDGSLLITEKAGKLLLRQADGSTLTVSGTPLVAYGGQGGLGDVVLHPEFASNQLVYLSYAEVGDGGRGATVARARLERNKDGAALVDLQIVWRQVPKVSGEGHYGHRIAFGPEGYLWISSGERQKFDPAQDMQSTLGKIVRLTPAGHVPLSNPFVGQGDVAAPIWSLGHRNPLGLAFDPGGRLWVVEMGPAGGDELNLVERGANYGYPLVSNGDHYDGSDIPDHDQRPDLHPPAISWTPVISPSSLMFYSGSEFPQWQGSAFIGGLSSKGLVRVEFDAQGVPREAERIPMDARIREVEQGPDGAIWVLEDSRKGSEGRLLRLSGPSP
jgi:glucose/arabinose dehydrogenase